MTGSKITSSLRWIGSSRRYIRPVKGKKGPEL